MKHFSSCLFFCLLIALPAWAQWQWLNPKPNVYTGKVVQFIDANRGFILQDLGIVLRTDDAGVSWREVRRQPDAVDLRFSPDGVGYLLTRPGVLWRSIDGGTTWERVSGSVQTPSSGYSYPVLQHSYARLHVISADTVWEVAENGLVRRSADGGRRWQQYSTGLSSILSSSFVSGRVGYLGTGGGRIYRTIDGGASWVKQTEVNYFPSEITMLHFLTPKIGMAHREHSDLLRTTDGGQTWSVLPNRLEDIYAMYFVSATDGFAVGDYGSLYKTTSAGAFWTSLGPTGGALYGGSRWNSVYFTSPTTGYVTGQSTRGPILRTTDGGLTWLPLSPLMGNIQAVEFPNHGLVGYALSTSGVLKTIDGGDTWTAVTQITGNKMACPDATTIIIVANRGVVSRSGDGGQTWTSTTIPPRLASFTNNLLTISMVDSQIGFVGGEDNALGQVIARTTDGGQSWQTVPGPAINSLRNFNFVSATTGFATGYNDAFKTTDGGQNWQLLPMGTYAGASGLCFVDAQTGYVIDESGSIFKTTNGGTTWTRLRMNRSGTYASGHPKNLHFFDANVGCVQDDMGNIFRTSDGGTTWIWERNIGSQALDYTHGGQSLVLGGSNGMLVRLALQASSLPFRARVLPPAALTDSSAVLAGVVKSLNAIVDSVRYEYGPVSAAGYNKVAYAYPVPWYGTDSMQAKVNKLQPATTYRVRLRFRHNGTHYYSPDTVFTTPARLVEPEPVVAAYPNPTTGYLHVLEPGQQTTALLELYTLQGTLVARTRGVGLDMASLRSGMYMLHITLGDTTYRKRIVKQ